MYTSGIVIIWPVQVLLLCFSTFHVQKWLKILHDKTLSTSNIKLSPRREAAPSGPIFVTSGTRDVGKTSSTCSLFTRTWPQGIEKIPLIMKKLTFLWKQNNLFYFANSYYWYKLHIPPSHLWGSKWLFEKVASLKDTPNLPLRCLDYFSSNMIQHSLLLTGNLSLIFLL